MSAQKIPLAGVIGSPIGHSKSPRLHRHWLKKYGLPGHYIPMEVTPDNLEIVLRTLPKAGFVGANITVPHKEVALEIADVITDRATLIGAANTLIFRDDGKIHADNTDGYGFLENLRQGAPNWDPTSGPVVVLGAGGASRAILASLLSAGVPEVLLTNRTKIRAEALQQEFGARITVIDWVQAGNVMEDAALLVNTTSLGMTGSPELRIPLDGLNPDAVVTDIVYAPLKTRLLQVAEEIGCHTVDGLGMLIYQAIPGFERWFGQRPDVDEEIRRIMLA